LTDYLEVAPGCEVPANWIIPSDTYYDQGAADQAVDFFPRYCVHVKGKWGGKPFELAGWQASRIIRPIFGLKRPDGTRLIRRVFIEIPRKNGKSLLGAGVALKMLFADGEPGAEVYSAAADKAQAALVYDVAALMVEKSKPLRARSKITRGNNRQILNVKTHGIYRVISADARRAHGFNSSAIVADELHVWQGGYVGSLLEALVTSTGSREQPLLFEITTAGYDHESICYREYARACKIRDGDLEDASFLPVIYEAPKDADFADEDVWRATNPNLDVSITRDYLADEALRAAEDPQEENAFRRLHLNQWTEQKVRWIPRDKWALCTLEDLVVPANAVCYCGLDLSTKGDTTAFVWAWYDGDRVGVGSHFWIPADNAVQREMAEQVPYRAWRDAGLITLTEGNVIDYEVVTDWILEFCRSHVVDLVGYDPYQAEMARQYLEKQGIETVAFGQTAKHMGPATAEFSRLWRSARLAHNGNPVLAFQASNVAVLEDSKGNITPAKNRSGDRIDGIVAAIMATWLLTAGERGLTAADVVA